MAKLTTSSGGRRLIWTVYHAALSFYAVQVFYSCIDGQESYPSWLDTALTELLTIAYKAIEESPGQVYRLAWPLTIALVKTRDPIHREWILTQVRRANILIGNLGIPEKLLNENRPSDTLFLDYDNTSLVDFAISQVQTLQGLQTITPV